MKPGDLYKRNETVYMVLECLERSWDFVSDDGREHSQHHIAHVKCVSLGGVEEFPLEWFCHSSEAISEDLP